MERTKLSTKLLGLSFVHIAVCLVFLKGFLLTRVELPDLSQCSPQDCRAEVQYTKAVVLIVDALRYDFVCENSSNDSAYRGKLPKTLAHVATAGPAAVATRFVADTPTITMSRLKALLTGGLPTFLDIGQSFSASALTEDNLLQHLLTRGKRLVVMGDDTWMQLAKDAFIEAYPYPSFDVHDLHTVDDGVQEHLVPLLSRPETWDILIAHYLGVDHAGHTYGVNSRHMSAKLQQMDDQVSQVIETLASQAGPGGAYEDTLLLVLSDHGQTQGGDHGGGTRDETDSVLLALSLRKMYQAAHKLHEASNPSAQSLQQHTSSLSTADPTQNSRPLLDQLVTAGGYSDPASPTHLSEQYPQLTPGPWFCNSSMSQIDLTPLVAHLLGVAVPFGNLGKIPPHLYAALAAGQDSGNSSTLGMHYDGAPVDDGASYPDWLMGYADALSANAEQVHRYLNRYAEVGGLPSADLASVNNLYIQVQQLRSRSSSSPGAVSHEAGTAGSRDLVLAQLTFLTSAADLARKRFTLFQQGPIWAGCALGVAVLAWQIRYCWRVIRGLAAAQAGMLDLASILLFTTLSAFHTLGLFSVGLLMGEGRLQCVLLAASTLLLLKVALQAVLQARKLASVQTSTAGQDLDAAGSMKMAGEAGGTELQHNNAQLSYGLLHVQGSATGPGTESVGHGRAVRVVVAAVVMLVCNVLLQALGLIDRSGQDPHDKTQPTAELLVGPDATVQRVGLLCFTVGPVIAVWLGTVWLAAWLGRNVTGNHQARDNPMQRMLHGRLLLFVKLCSTLAYVSVGAFWSAQMTGCNDLTLVPAIGLLLRHVPAKLQQSLVASAVQVTRALGLSYISQTFTAAGIGSLPRSIAQLPLRLLLPRVVYVSTLAAFGVGLLFVCVTPALAAILQMVLLQPASSNKRAGLQQQAVSCAGCQLLLWLCAAFAAAHTMVLGYRGPATMLLAVIQGACCCIMLRAHSAAHGELIGTTQANLLKDAGKGETNPSLHSNDCSKSDSVTSETGAKQLQNVVGAGVWGMMSLQLFFCSSHFCEFSGLQYASAFIGFDNMVMLASGSLLMLNTAGFLLLGCLTLPLMSLTSSSIGCPSPQRQSSTAINAAKQGVPMQVFKQQLTCGILVTNSMRFAALVVCMLSAAVQQQHILLWAIFAPKLVFELVFMAVTNAGHFLAAVLSEQLLWVH